MSVFTSDGTENRMRWDRVSAPFMEVWYSTLNDSSSGAGIWVRYTVTAPRDAPAHCDLWAFYFDPEGKRSFAGRNRFPIDRLGGANGRDDGAVVRIGDAWLSESHLEGAVTSGDRTMEWSLDMRPAERCFQHIPAKLRSRVEKRVSTVCSPNLSVPFSGTVTIDGDTARLADEVGCQSHRWGRKHSQTWAWAHCSRFGDSTDIVFEGVSARASVGPIPAPTTTFLYLSYEGDDLAFNEDIRSIFTARSHYEMPTWAFTASNDRFKIVGAARAQINKMVQITYTDPDGSNRFCANSEIASLAIEIYERAPTGWRHRDSLTAMGTAHLEFGRPDPFVELPIAL